MSKWQRFRRLPAPERSVLLRALVLVPVTALALRTIGFHRWNSLLLKFADHKHPAQAVTPESLASARRVAHLVAAASHEGIVGGKCLERSMVLWWLLLRKRMPAKLRIGVRQSGAGIEAHAWVEIEGKIVNDTEDVLDEYIPFHKDIGAPGVEPH